jgi:outer membrane protein TolC
MRRQWHRRVIVAAVVGLSTPVFGEPPQDAIAQIRQHLHTFDGRTYTAPVFTLDAALTEALARNPTLIALRAQFEVARQRPAQERSLMAPTFEAQIWQWPLTAINPADTSMYMFTIGQDLPGRGKRQLRTRLADKDVDIAENQIAVRARDILAEVKRTYAELFVARKDIEIHLSSVELLRQFVDISQAKYATGRISQQDVVKAVVELSTFARIQLLGRRLGRLHRAVRGRRPNRRGDGRVPP